MVKAISNHKLSTQQKQVDQAWTEATKTVAINLITQCHDTQWCNIANVDSQPDLGLKIPLTSANSQQSVD